MSNKNTASLNETMQYRYIIAERFTYHFVIAVWRAKGRIHRVKYWEIIADNLHKAGWSLGWVSALHLDGRTIWIVDAHGYGKRLSYVPMKS